MTSTFTTNIDLEQPARGDDVGTWDTPVNANMSVIDTCIGGRVSISLNNSPVVLSAAQFQAKIITFISTLTGSVTITFPSTFKKSYEIWNACTGSSAFTITLQTTTAGATKVCAPPGEIVTIANYDGFNLNYVDLGRVGSYWDYAGSSVPAWVSGCTTPPYLSCDGSTFSAGTYPNLANILGGTTLPDTRGRVRAALVQGTTRLTSAVAGFSPTTVGAAGGDEALQIHSHNTSINDPTHNHTTNAFTGPAASGNNNGGGGGSFGVVSAAAVNVAALTGITVNNPTAGTGSGQNIQPTYIGGITMIRAG